MSLPPKVTATATTNSNDRQPMGDKSPKSVQKQANQKQQKSNSADQKKKQAEAAKTATKKK
ncbi:MAG TPA: hypothetical protein VK633_10975 [Verrucomicrobiae bacterium]|nr:hypothetical protein [Verrucomicrobiae bacterium]